MQRLPANSPVRADSAEGMFIELALQWIETELLVIETPPLEGMRFVYTDESVPEGAEQTGYIQLTRVGQAAMGTDGATDAPTSRFFTEKFTHDAKVIKEAYSFTYDEMIAAQFASTRSAAMGGPAIVMELQLAMAARIAVETTLDTIIAFGTAAPPTGINPVGPDVGILGLLNQPNTLTYAIPNGAQGSPLWSMKTPDEVVADLTGIVAAMISATFKLHSPKRIIVEAGKYESQLAGRRMGDGSDQTILSFFQTTRAATKAPVTVDSWTHMQGAGSGGTDLLLAYDPARENVKHVLSKRFTQMQTEYHNEAWRTPCRAKTYGVFAQKPLSMSYAFGY